MIREIKNGHMPVFYFLLLFLGFFFDVQNFSALVMTAIWTYSVRKTHLTTVTALNQIQGLQRVMGATAISSTF